MVEVLRRPGVAAEDVETVLRVHADRVHDAVRRLGADADAAVEIVETSALSLVDAVAERPDQVTDAVGWWFAEARRLAGRVAVSPGDDDLPVGGGVLSSDEDQLVLAEALHELPPDERLALLMRDAYRLPLASVAVALETTETGALATVARGRLHAVPLLDDEPAPDVPPHPGAPGVLAQLGESGPAAPVDATVRRHVQGCAECEAVRAAQERVHLLLSGLAVAALPEQSRGPLLRAATSRAAAVLPPASAFALTDEEWQDWEDEHRTLSPLLAVLGVLAAVLLGTGLGVLLSRGADAVLPAASDVLPPVQVPTVDQPAPIRLPDLPPPPPVTSPETTVFFLPEPTTAPPEPSPTTPAPTASASASAPRSAPAITLDPTSGPEGTTITVTGTGWTPGSSVVVQFLRPGGRPTGSQATATVGADGTFATELTASDPTGGTGERTVRADDGSRRASAEFELTE
ncbi:MAG: RNA polymerase sigma factor [Actinomycetes bacterium]